MKKRILFPVISALLLLGAACSDDDKKQDEPTPPTPPEPEKVVVEFTDAETTFLKQLTPACSKLLTMLCEETSTKDENIVISPLSVVQNLRELSSHIYMPEVALFTSETDYILNNLTIHGNVPKELYKKLSELDPSVSLRPASALFCDEEFFEEYVFDSESGNIAVGIVEAPKTDKDPTMADYVNDWLATNLAPTAGFANATLKDYPTLVSTMKLNAGWGESTISVGTGLLLQYREKAEVLTGSQCYAVRVPLGSADAFEAVIVKANTGVDIDDVIASGEVFTVGDGRVAEKPFTVGFPMGAMSTSPNLPFDKVIARLLEGFDYDRHNPDGLSKPMLELVKPYALGSLSFSKGGMTAGSGNASAVTSRSSADVDGGFINVADGNCVILVREKTTGACLIAARIAAV